MSFIEGVVKDYDEKKFGKEDEKDMHGKTVY